jgi:hypothetical protein
MLKYLDNEKPRIIIGSTFGTGEKTTVSQSFAP